MSIAFVFLFIVADWLAHINVINYRQGLQDHFYSLNLVGAIELFLAVGAVWYLGWVIGIIVSVLAVIRGVYKIIGWVLSLPTYRSFNPYTVCRWAEWEVFALIPAAIIVAAFVTVSFFVTKFGCLSAALNNNTVALIIAAAIVVFGPIARHYVEDNL